MRAAREGVSMKSLPKEKRNSLILVGFLTIGIIAGLWFFLIEMQFSKLKDVSDRIIAAQTRQETMQRAIKNAVQIESDLHTESKRLASYENDMGSGDLYLWQINMIKNFKGDRPVEIPELLAGALTDCTLLPKFPYRQVIVTVGGSGYYHEIGKFVSDFENTYPFMRIVNLQMFPKSTQVQAEKERVGFKFEIVTLTKPGV
jgi:hypothetical protein